jgi:NitT/TauT family transport system permease protein
MAKLAESQRMKRLINHIPSRAAKIILGAAPFLASILIYAICSAFRHAENPTDKLLPGLGAFADAINRMAFTPDMRTGEYLLWVDTGASLRRLLEGLASATALGLCFGIATGLIPFMRAGLSPFIAILSMIPPMAVLPILFITFGLGEVSKIVLITVGVAPFMIRDLSLRVNDIPSELLIKAQTLGASTWQIILRVILPQVMPRLIDAVRLSLGPAWLFLISAEAIASTDGLGFRIFLMRRYLAMDVILPYVAWVTLLAFVMDYALRLTSRRCFPWAMLGAR